MGKSGTAMARERDPLVVGGVIGDVVDQFTASFPLRVIYNGREISNGCEHRTSAVVSPPRVIVGGDEMRTLFTLVRTQIDR